MTINTEDHKEVINRLIRKYLSCEPIIHFVNSTKEWCIEHKVNACNSDNIAVTVFNENSKIHEFVFLKNISENDVNSAKTAMEARHFYADTQKLKSHDLFMKHTILHEIAHAMGKNEENANKWAFDEMKTNGWI